MRNGLINLHWDVVSAQIISADTNQAHNYHQVAVCKKVDISVLKGRIDTKIKAHMVTIFIIRV